MHKYADLKKNRSITSLQGNLVVSKRRKPIPRQTITSQLPIKTWLFILFMFVVSGLYIRYQALHVGDSVFRDAYLLINEHFIAKPVLPPPGETISSETSTVIETTTTLNNTVSATETPSPQGSVVPNNPAIAQSQTQSQPLNNTSTVPVTSTTSTTSTVSTASTSSAVTPNQDIIKANTGVVNTTATVVPANTQPTTANVNTTANIPPVEYSAQSVQNIQEGGLTTQVAQNAKSLQGITANQGVNQNQLLLEQSVPPAPSLSKPQEKVFSYYHPVLNSTSTKVGFFVVNKKTTFRKETFYQDLLVNLVKFESSNPKVRNFFDPRTRINNAWVENDTLILDFNSFFENSKYGYMGMEAKLQQVLWTFFNYDQDQINRVSYISFLIDGKRRDTIGGDGKILKPFYSRKNLSSIVKL